MYRAFAAQARRRPAATALIAPDGRPQTYAGLQRAVLQMATVLHKRLPAGPAPVVLVADPGATGVAILLACSALGRTLAPLNPALAPGQLAAAVHRLAPCALIYDPRVRGRLPCERRAGLKRHSTEELAEAARRAGPLAPALLDDHADNILLLTLSSGSTGDPKPVMFSEHNKIERARQNAREFGVVDTDCILCASPLFHSLGQRLTILPLLSGATLALLERFTPQRWMTALERDRVSFTIAVSSHLGALREELLALRPGDTTLRALVSSSAGIDREAKHALFASRAFEFHEMYGASEVGTVTRLSAPDAAAHLDSVGRICRGIDVAILGEDGEPLATGRTGQIAVSSPLASPGYYRRPDLDAKAWRKGYFLTGDLGCLDEHGVLYFLDRLSDVINCGGSNIYPSDVEAVLRPVAGIGDCLVTGIADPYFGEAVIAVVATGSDLTDTQARRLERTLRRTARAHLAPPQQPLAYFFVTELPYGATGKVDRRAVRASYNALQLDLSAPLRALQSGSGR